MEHVFGVEESIIFRSVTKLPCPGDLENSGQLPVFQLLEGTNFGSYLGFRIFLFSMFLKSRNPFCVAP